VRARGFHGRRRCAQVGGPLEEATEAAWDAIFDVNTKAAFVAARAAAPALKAARGHCITISSGAGVHPSLTRLHAYCAAKHALVGLTKQPPRSSRRLAKALVAASPASLSL